MKIYKRIVLFILIVFIIVICLIIGILYVNGMFRSKNNIKKEFLKNKESFEKITLLLENEQQIHFYNDGNNTFRIRKNENEDFMNDTDKKEYEYIINFMKKLKLSSIIKTNDVLTFRYMTLSLETPLIVYTKNIDEYFNEKDLLKENIIDNWYYIDIIT